LNNFFTRKKLHVIEGGLRRDFTLGDLKIVVCPEASPPFAVQAVAVEEDTWLIISADPTITQPEEHPIRLMTDLMNTEKESVGSVKVKEGHPLRFLAIVHDVDSEPTWREEWVESALSEVLREAEKRRLSAIAVPLLGTRHGHLPTRRFAKLLAAALGSVERKNLKRLWLVAPAGRIAEVSDRLQDLLK
jgi:hypothetical protein